MSSTTVKRKQYVIGYRGDDVLHYNPDYKYDGVAPLLPEGLRKYADVITGEDLVSLLPEGPRRMSISRTQSFLLVTRRAAARRIMQILKDTRYHSHTEFTVIPVGEFKREVKPVKHWNIERQYRVRRDGGKPGKYSAPDVWSRGIKLREGARKQADELNKAHAEDPTYQFKFRAVAVYA